MTRVFRVACWAAVIGLAPSVASAALSLRIGGQGNPLSPDGTFFPPGGQHFFDLIFTETDPAENEGLFAYDLGLRVNHGGRPGGLRLAGAERPTANYVLDVASGSTFTVAGNTAEHLLVNVSSNNDLADINTGDVAARIFFTLDTVTGPGVYSITFDAGETVFGSGDPNRDLNIAVNLEDHGFVIWIPEPGSLSLLAAAGTLALRRYRRAGSR